MTITAMFWTFSSWRKVLIKTSSELSELLKWASRMAVWSSTYICSGSQCASVSPVLPAHAIPRSVGNISTQLNHKSLTPGATQPTVQATFHLCPSLPTTDLEERKQTKAVTANHPQLGSSCSLLPAVGFYVCLFDQQQGEDEGADQTPSIAQVSSSRSEHLPSTHCLLFHLPVSNSSSSQEQGEERAP